MKYEKLKLGLDLGTDSVGWALLDQNNQLIKKNGFTFWGVRMFDQASDAKGRRSFRSARRRLQRRKERLDLLQQIFDKEIKKVDSNFFERLEDSFFKMEDKRNKNKHTLFDGEFNDKEYFKKYKTIYHLRKELISSNEKADIRMIYLALHNIIKYRGNFLLASDEFRKNDDSLIKQYLEEINGKISELKEYISSIDDEGYNEDYYKTNDINEQFVKELGEILVERTGKKTKQEKLNQLFNVGNNTLVNECIIKLLSGSKVNFANLKCVKGKGYDKIEIELDCENIESVADDAKGVIPDLSILFDCLVLLKNIVDHYYVIKVLGSADSYSEAMCNLYDNHQQDLKLLKKFVKQYNKDKYKECFNEHEEKLCNYSAYVGRNSDSKKIEHFKHCSQTEFYDYLKKKILNVNVDENGQKIKDEILLKIDMLEFLPRQNSSSNGSFPMQLHLAELKQILKNQEPYYPFLLEKEDGFTNSEKIIKIFKYKLPYYVGPLNRKSPYSWVIRSDNPIKPWNFEQVVDLDKTAEEFIRRMQNKCSYLKVDKDYCLPKNSIIFSEYNCLSYLNKLQINGSAISKELKDEIFNNVFLKQRKPTKKDILKYLEKTNGVGSVKDTLPELNANMSSYVVFKEIFKETFNENIDLIEDIIKDIILFEDKSLLEKRLRNVYHLDNEKVKQIKNINYSGYGRLSKTLLVDLQVVSHNTGEIKGSVLDIMRNTNMNLQEILYHPDYRLIDQIDEYNEKFISKEEESLEEFIDENINVSPLIKRPIIQAVKIIDEIERIFNRKIDEFYIECTRTNKDKNKGKSPKSRYDIIKEYYSDIKEVKDGTDLKKLKKELEANKDNLKSDLLYLYFTQLGKCMYSLDPIDINQLINNNNQYDIDHIYPQAIIKDDSMSNRVLVKKDLNNLKQESFLFELNIKNKNADQFYKMLLDKKLITAEKYRRLTIKELNEKELDNFVNRQIVVTNQSVKGLIEVLKLYKNIEANNIIYSKGENISDFRHKFDLVKSRTANNFHHAHDAYLNVIVGGVIHEYFTKNRFLHNFKDYQRMKSENLTINLTKIFERNTIKINNNTIWEKDKMVKQIKKDLYNRFDVNETFRSYSPQEMFSQVTIMPAAEGQLVPVKTSDERLIETQKYGGIKQASYARYVIVKVNKNDKVQMILEAIPKTSVPTLNDEEKNMSAIRNYLESIYGNNLINVENYNIKSNVVIKDDKKKYVITGKSSDAYLIKNINDRYFDYEKTKIIKKIDKYMDQIKKGVKMSVEGDKIIIAVAKNEECSEIILNKGELMFIFDTIVKNFQKDLYSYSNIITIGKNLSFKRDEAFNLNIEELIKLIYEMLQLLKTNERKTIDLSSIDLSKNSGKISISKTLKEGQKFVHESVTGYYSKVLYEVK